MIHHYTRQDISRALREIGLKNGDTVFSHSNVGFLGIPMGGTTPQHVANLITEALFDVIGELGTLIVPTFTYSFSQGRTFDPEHTPSDCGIFTEEVRKSRGAVRSEDPSVSVAAMGSRAVEMTANLSENAYDDNSFFARFHRVGGVICNINFDAGSTFIHYVERCLKVPYRFDKTFDGLFEKNGKKETRCSTLWVRHLVDETRPKFEVFDALAREAGLYRTAFVGRGFIGAISACDVFQLIQETLPAYPKFLITG